MRSGSTTKPLRRSSIPIPEHTRYRRFVQPGFGPSATRDLEPVVPLPSKALVDQIPPASRSTWSRPCLFPFHCS